MLLLGSRAEVDGRAGHDGRLAHVGHAHRVGPQGTRVHALLVDPVILAQRGAETGIDAGIADHFRCGKRIRIVLESGIRHHLPVIVRVCSGFKT